MSLAAESFVGRVVAVVSRRSPGFRPAPAPRSGGGRTVAPTATDALVGSVGLAVVTAEWRRAPAASRLRHRDTLLALADRLRTVQRYTAALAEKSGQRGSARWLRHLLNDALPLAFSLDHRVAHVIEQMTRTLSWDFGFWHTHDLGTRLFADLSAACENLMAAANDFLGEDLTGGDLDAHDLAWVRWDENTRWPSEEWAARVRRASAEHPIGSGVFVVLPEEERENQTVLV